MSKLTYYVKKLALKQFWKTEGGKANVTNSLHSGCYWWYHIREFYWAHLNPEKFSPLLPKNIEKPISPLIKPPKIKPSFAYFYIHPIVSRPIVMGYFNEISSLEQTDYAYIMSGERSL